MAAIVPPPTVKVYYGKPMLPDVSRVLACLYEKEIDFKLVDMYEGHYMPEHVLKLHATTMRAPVTAFEDGSKLLLESRTICRYVSEKYADRGSMYLLGRDLLERGSIEQWLKTEEQSFNPPSWTLVFHLAFNPMTHINEQDQSLIIQSEQVLAKVLDVYEHRLRESEYLAGDEFTLADLSHLPNTHYLANSKEWRYLFNSRKNVQNWWEKISSRPSWVKVVGMLKEFEVPKKSAPTTKETSVEKQSSVSPPLTKISDQQKSMITQSKPATVEQKSPNSSTSGPNITVARKNSAEAPTLEKKSQSEPTSQPTPQPPKGDSSGSEPTNTTTQSVTAEQKSPSSSTSGPNTTVARKNSAEAPTLEKKSQSEPTSQPTPQPPKGDSSGSEPTNTTTQSVTAEQKSPSSSTSGPNTTVAPKNSAEAPTLDQKSQSEPTSQSTPQPPKGDSSGSEPTNTTSQSNSVTAEQTSNQPDSDGSATNPGKTAESSKY